MSSFCVTAQNSNLPNMSLVRLASLIRLSLVVTFTFTVSFVKLFTFLLFIAFSNHPGSSLDWSINYLYHSDPVSLQWRRSFFTGSDATSKCWGNTRRHHQHWMGWWCSLFLRWHSTDPCDLSRFWKASVLTCTESSIRVMPAVSRRLLTMAHRNNLVTVLASMFYVKEAILPCLEAASWFTECW